MSGSNAFVAALPPRRSVYALNDSALPISDEQVVEIVKEVVKWTPSSFNSQSTRAVVLFGKNHKHLWADITKAALKAIVPAEQFAPTEQKIDAFAGAYGTVLFFEDEEVIKGMQQQFAQYADFFPEWAAHSTGAASINVWTALAQDKIGASLQHYGPLVKDQVAKEWNIPSTWRLTGQLVFGNIVAPAGEKTFKSDTVKVFN